MCDIKSSPGELGLKAAGAEDYFGLIYIGDTSAFKKLVEEDASGITLEDDAIAASLFERINRPDSGIHVLIGAKKFMEGWNSWRVASMGLLNIGRQEGSQIIQLFGRGVRLKGRAMSLKRSAALDGTHPKHIRLLETLNIFAVRANYMAQFRDYLEREGVEVDPPIELPLFVQINEQFFKRDLVVPRPREGGDFAREVSLLLEADASIPVQVDLSVKVQAMESTNRGLRTAEVRSGQARPLPPESLGLVDWNEAYLKVLAYKTQKGLNNLVVRPEILPQIIKCTNDKGVPICTLIAEDRVFVPKSFADRTLVQQAVIRLLCRYVDRFYQWRREHWDEQTMVYYPLGPDDPNFAFRPQSVREEKAGYVLKIPRSEQQLVSAVQDLLRDEKKLRMQENGDLPRLNFDRHIYVPLLLEKEGIQISPPALNKSERKFVEDLRDYWNAEKDKSLAGKEIFLLRNLSRGHGIGFFEGSNFYPDFILWVIDQTGQRIIFIEPHGMMHAEPYANDPKAHLWEKLPGLAAEINSRTNRTDITLDSFIVSATPYAELQRNYGEGTWDRATFAEKHILFPERRNDYDYIALILR